MALDSHEEVRHFRGADEIKRREVVLDSHEEVRHFRGADEIKRREVVLDLFCISCSSTAELRTLSL